jgi:hypothetical protein
MIGVIDVNIFSGSIAAVFFVLNILLCCVVGEEKRTGVRTGVLLFSPSIHLRTEAEPASETL